MKKIHVKDFKLNMGTELTAPCNLFVTKGTTTTGKPFLKVCVSDSTFNFTQSIWDSDPLYPTLEKFTTSIVAELTCKYVGIESGYDKYLFTNIKVLKQKYLKDCADIDTMKDELRGIISKMTDLALRDLVYSVFNDADLKELIFEAPLSDKNGGSFEGGLLVNILRSCNLSLAIANVYNFWNHNTDGSEVSVNTDLLITASIFSNLGVVDSLQMVGDTVVKTFEGSMHEDSFLSYKRLLRLLETSTLSDFSKTYLENIVTSSRGSLEYGGLNVARCTEAIIFQNIQRIERNICNMEYLRRVAFEDFGKLQPYDMQKKYFVEDY